MGGGRGDELLSPSSAREDRTTKGDDGDADVTPVAKHDDVEKSRKADTAVGAAVVVDNDKAAQNMVEMINSRNFGRRQPRFILLSLFVLTGNLPLRK
mmetsp:Transcript_50894/g.122696  ORF Transcript_50894/g.122696 Transcript_50894/m.122696 type:complete len:97 (+) Transcript_50894:623-913(+)